MVADGRTERRLERCGSTSAPRAPTSTPMTHRLLALAPFVVLPWAWFLVRDAHPAADVVALGMPVLVSAAVACCLVLVVWRRRLCTLATTASWVLFGLVVIVGPWTPRSGPAPVDAVRIVGANTFGSFSDPPSIAEDIAAQAPDLVVVSEVSDGVEEELSRRFATTHVGVIGLTGRPDVVVFSDLPVEQLEMPDALRSRGVRLLVSGPSGPFTLYGLHLPPPRARPAGGPEVSVRGHQEIVRAVRDAVRSEDGPVVVAGDLNLVDRTSGYRRLTAILDDAMRSGWVRPTSWRKATAPLLGRVDHVFISETWCASGSTIFALTGSDHLGIAVDAGGCPP